MAIRYVLNSKGRYVPDHESDLLMDSVKYSNWLYSLCSRLPEKIKDDESLTGERPPTVNEMIESLKDVYTERDLGKKSHYEALPKEYQRRRKQGFLDNHFKIPEEHSREDELIEIKSKAFETDNYDELQTLLTDFLNKRYSDRQVPNIYRSAHKRALKKSKASFLDKGGLEKMNKELEYREPVPVTLFSQEELAPFIQEVAKPDEKKPEVRTVYMLNSEGLYVTKGESNLFIGKKGCSESKRSLLEELKTKASGRGPGKKGITPTGVLEAMAGYLFEDKNYLWHILPPKTKMRKIESLCEVHGMDPSGISTKQDFINAFVESKRTLWVGETKKGKSDFRKVYAICNDFIRRQGEENKKPVTQESIDEINNDLRFPEPYQIPLPLYSW